MICNKKSTLEVSEKPDITFMGRGFPLYERIPNPTRKLIGTVVETDFKFILQEDAKY